MLFRSQPRPTRQNFKSGRWPQNLLLRQRTFEAGPCSSWEGVQPCELSPSFPRRGFHGGSQICRTFRRPWPLWGRRACPLSWLNFEALMWYTQDRPRASQPKTVSIQIFLVFNGWSIFLRDRSPLELEFVSCCVEDALSHSE